tara:strand:- start:3230 stop:3403 length:174 start_codon:yes stop_codon:yes gene_type:complete
MIRNLTLKLTPAQHSALSKAIDYWVTVCDDEILSDDITWRNKHIGEKRALQNIRMWK